ncbi:MAG: hypothetical protein JXQ30_15135 [Spirochaetes bacterium]|nr:hypothetical protein [Spirochaetota bacterium]
MRCGGFIAREFVPQKALMPYADVVVHHGGSNSFSEALCCSTSMVLLPFSSDQFDIARDPCGWASRRSWPRIRLKCLKWYMRSILRFA